MPVGRGGITEDLFRSVGIYGIAKLAPDDVKDDFDAFVEALEAVFNELIYVSASVGSHKMNCCRDEETGLTIEEQWPPVDEWEGSKAQKEAEKERKKGKKEVEKKCSCCVIRRKEFSVSGDRGISFKSRLTVGPVTVRFKIAMQLETFLEKSTLDLSPVNCNPQRGLCEDMSAIANVSWVLSGDFNFEIESSPNSPAGKIATLLGGAGLEIELDANTSGYAKIPLSCD